MLHLLLQLLQCTHASTLEEYRPGLGCISAAKVAEAEHEKDQKVMQLGESVRSNSSAINSSRGSAFHSPRGP